MAKPRSINLRGSSLYRPQIWCVDDAWFEGGLGSIPSIDTYLDFQELDQVQGLVAKIEELEDKAALEGRGWPAAEGDIQYLKQLAAICREHDFNLLLCNFEYFDAEFNNANIARSAILLDVYYYQGTQYNKEGYGAYLLVDKLRGRRPRADIFFVTGEPATLRDLTLAKAGDPLWWPVRTVPFVNKGSRLDTELQAFADYFQQGMNQEPLKEFAGALLRAQKEEFSHPATFDTTKEKTVVPEDFLLRESFAPYDDLEIESFKALYDYPSATIRGEGCRNISARVFAEHLRYGGVKVVHSGDDKLRLPIQPGMLFIMNLLKFLDQWEGDEIALTVNNREDGGEATIAIPAIQPRVLEEALVTGGGKSTELLRRLLACKKNVFVESVVTPEGEELASKWNLPEPMPSRTKVYKRVIKHCFTDDAIKLSWTYSF